MNGSHWLRAARLEGTYLPHKWSLGAVLLVAVGLLVGCAPSSLPDGQSNGSPTSPLAESDAGSGSERPDVASDEMAPDDPSGQTTDSALAAADSRAADDTKSLERALPEGAASSAAEPPPEAILRGVPPAKSDTLVRAYGNDPDTLNVVTGSDTVGEEFQSLVYEYLAQRDFHDPDRLTPLLAERWEFDPERLEYTIHLRRGVLWHPMRLPNGRMLPRREFTARDVKFTFDCVLNGGIEAAHIRSYYEDPDATEIAEKYKIRVTVVDDYTVKVRWTKPYMLAEEFTLGGVQILPRHVYSVDGNGEPISFDFSSQEFADGFNNHWANNQMCGTGPMMFHEWRRDERLVLVRNPEYWGEPFYFDRVVFRCIPNPNTIVKQVLQNELDWGVIPEKDQYLQNLTHGNVTAGRVKLVEFAYPGYRYVGYNMEREFFRDPRVRWALSYATPVDKIIEEVFKGLALRTTGPFQPGSSAYESSLELIPHNLDEARRLLDEAGWVDSNQDGIRDKTVGGIRLDARFDLMIYADSPSFGTIAEIIKENCRRIGVDVLVTPAKWALMLEKLNKKEFDAAMLGWAQPWKPDPFQIFHGSQADVPDSSNFIGYKNPELDRVIDELRVTLDPARQIELYHQVHRIIYQDQPYTFLFVDKRTAGHDARLQNVEFFKIRPCIDPREWYSSRPRSAGG